MSGTHVVQMWRTRSGKTRVSLEADDLPWFRPPRGHGDACATHPPVSGSFESGRPHSAEAACDNALGQSAGGALHVVHLHGHGSLLMRAQVSRNEIPPPVYSS